jgi:hypothetical protein
MGNYRIGRLILFRKSENVKGVTNDSILFFRHICGRASIYLR